jgi:hypothetical protein
LGFNQQQQIAKGSINPNGLGIYLIDQGKDELFVHTTESHSTTSQIITIDLLPNKEPGTIMGISSIQGDAHDYRVDRV